MSQRGQSDLAELGKRIAALVKEDGRVQAQPGLLLLRRSEVTQCIPALAEPMFCVIAQGAKNVYLGGATFRYDTAHYLVSTVDLPISTQIVEASASEPYLGLALTLDPTMVASVMMDAGFAPSRDGGGVKAMDVSRLQPELLDATLRLVRLLDSPTDYPVLGPLVIREIIYRLLTGAQGARMHHLATFGGHSHRMARAVKILRENYAKPLRIESLAKELGMSVSGFHAHFKAVTEMSPLQFQKQLRLQEARRLMISDNLDAAEAGFRVGYEDASHFSREYKRQFGAPPLRDVEQFRQLSINDASVA